MGSYSETNFYDLYRLNSSEQIRVRKQRDLITVISDKSFLSVFLFDLFETAEEKLTKVN